MEDVQENGNAIIIPENKKAFDDVIMKCVTCVRFGFLLFSFKVFKKKEKIISI